MINEMTGDNWNRALRNFLRWKEFLEAIFNYIEPFYFWHRWNTRHMKVVYENCGESSTEQKQSPLFRSLRPTKFPEKTIFELQFSNVVHHRSQFNGFQWMYSLIWKKKLIPDDCSWVIFPNQQESWQVIVTTIEKLLWQLCKIFISLLFPFNRLMAVRDSGISHDLN